MERWYALVSRTLGQSKFGSTTLGGILIELCSKAGITVEDIDIGSIDEVVRGLVVDHPASTWDIINTLRCGYLFDVVIGTQGKVRFIKYDTGVPAIAFSHTPKSSRPIF